MFLWAMGVSLSFVKFSFWVVHVIVGLVLNVYFGKQLAHNVYMNVLIYSMQNGFMFSCLVWQWISMHVL